MTYIREFTCELTGTEVVILEDNGEEIAMDKHKYIMNHYSEAEHHEAIQRWEAGEVSEYPRHIQDMY